ncbi:MAG: metallophosphoesterase [Armatimonadota bacterium]
MIRGRGLLLVFAVLLAALSALGRAGASCATPLTFAVIADVQYADQDDSGSRHYRASLEKLQQCVADLNTKPLAFAIQLGDIVDRGSDNLDRVIAVFNDLKAPKHHVLGNHDVTVGREAAYVRLGLTAPYYSFAADKWRFVVLDCSDVSVEGGWPEGSEHYRQGRDWLEQLKREASPNAETWNGGIGEEQLQWLKQQLAEAKAERQRVIVFGHMPVLAAACADWALLYNHEEVAQLLESSGVVAAYICGHEHAGGYGQRNGVHYLTVQGMVEAPETAYAVLTLYEDRMEVRGTGSVPTRTLRLSPPASSR